MHIIIIEADHLLAPFTQSSQTLLSLLVYNFLEKGVADLLIVIFVLLILYWSFVFIWSVFNLLLFLPVHPAGLHSTHSWVLLLNLPHLLELFVQYSSNFVLWLRFKLICELGHLVLLLFLLLTYFLFLA